MSSLLKKAYDPEQFRQFGHQLVDHLSDYLHRALAEKEGQVIPYVEPSAAAEKWEATLRRSGEVRPLDLFEAVLAEGIHLHNPRYMGHQISPPAPVAALSGLLNDFMNNGMGVYEMGIPGSAMERAVVRAVAKQMGFGEQADGVLTSGGSLSNLTALLAARSVRARENVWQAGQSAQLALLVSEEAHYSVDRVVRIMGWGEAGIIKVPVNERYEMRTELLESCLAEAKAQGKEVIAVVGSACSTSTGSFDNLREIGAFAARHNLWFHVDGAHGAACIYSSKYRHLLDGIETADSVTMDFHKMLLTPSVTTALIFRDGRHSFQTFAQKAQYLFSQESEPEWFQLAKRTFECTKTQLSLRAFTLMAVYGPALFDEYITNVNDLSAALATTIEQRPHWELAVPPACNIVCFRYCRPGHTEPELNRLNDSIRQVMVEEGDYYLVKTVLRGKTFLRVTLTNPFTTETEWTGMLERLEALGNK